MGKTWLMNKVRGMLAEMNLDVCSAAYTGAAASLIRGAQTIHSAFGIPATSASGEADLPALSATDLASHSQKFSNVGCVIIDEVSMVSTVMLAKISERLCQIKGNREPFGGLDVLLVGDFMQLRPVAGTPLYADAVDPGNKGKPTSFKVAGATLFSAFQLQVLKEQVRAADDQEHSEILESLRDATSKWPVTANVTRYLTKKILTPQDLQEAAWNEAPVCVTGNQERLNLTPIMAQRFAERRGVPLITWNLDVRKNSSKLFPENELTPLNSGLVGMFVAGAPAYLTENLNPSLNLANGSRVTLHSLTFAGHTAEQNEDP